MPPCNYPVNFFDSEVILDCTVDIIFQKNFKTKSYSACFFRTNSNFKYKLL